MAVEDTRMAVEDTRMAVEDTRMAVDHSEQEHDIGKQQCHVSEGNAKAFEFLNLPAEIRNMIYWILLVKRYGCRHFRQPALTLVNKQIRSESLPVLYGNGTFVFVERRWFFRLQRLPPARPNLAHITKLDIRIPIHPLTGGLELEIRMRKNKWECGHLRHKRLVGEPGVEWKSIAKVQAVYVQLLRKFLRVGGPRHEIVYIRRAFPEGAILVIRGLLYFAEKCPAAAEWVWMALKQRNPGF